MNIALNSETQKLLEEKLRSGEYRSADEIVQAALKALSDRDIPGLDEEVLNALDRAEDQIDRGEVHEWKDVREKVRDAFHGK